MDRVDPYSVLLQRPQGPNRSSARAAFTLLELVIVISIISILAGALTPVMSKRLSKSRDVRRLTDIRGIQAAIEQYYADTGAYPPAVGSAAFSNWDVSHDGGFLPELKRNGYLIDALVDPVNDDTYHYRYRVYSAGSHGCVGYGDFYVLGIREFEGDEYAAQNSGFFECSGRDWGAEFDYVTGGGATRN